MNGRPIRYGFRANVKVIRYNVNIGLVFSCLQLASFRTEFPVVFAAYGKETALRNVPFPCETKEIETSSHKLIIDIYLSTP